MALNTKTTTSSGIKRRKKLPRGRELHKLKRNLMLLRYAAKNKLCGRIPNTRFGDLNVRQRIKCLKKQIQQVKSSQTLYYHQPSSLNNSVGSVDNTSVNELCNPRPSAVRYLNRQKTYKWLATHVWHVKRAHMVKRWGYQIPLKPTQKAFRATHRSSVLNGCVTWDTSYMGTLTIVAKDQETISSVVSGITKAMYKFSCKKMWEGYIFQDDQLLGPVTVFPTGVPSAVALQLHPAIYTDVFGMLVGLQDVEVHDCRYSIGSIEVKGPSCLSALSSVLHIEDERWNSIAKMQDVSTIPAGSVMAFQVDDPRLWGKPYKFHQPHFDESEIIDTIIAIREGACIDAVASRNLFTVEGRVNSYNHQPSLKQLAKRRDLHPGKPIAKQDSDPQIPLVLAKTSRNSWKLLLPWFWVLPVWHILNMVSNANLGGLDQFHQLDFEKGKCFFPDDYPFTLHGWAENEAKAEALSKKWKRVPKGKRVNYEKILIGSADCYKGEVGSPFKCDWRFLQLLHEALKIQAQSVNIPVDDFDTSNWNRMGDRILKEDADVYGAIKDLLSLDEEKRARGEPLLNPVTLNDSSQNSLSVVPVSIRTVSKGHPHDNARIYSIPPEDYDKWVTSLKLFSASGKPSSISQPVCPAAKYLVGFVTSGTFNLGTGSGSGVGCIAREFADLSHKQRYVVVRNVGESLGRLCEWNLINF